MVSRPSGSLSGSGKIALGAINFAVWTAPVRLLVLMERTPVIIILSKRNVLAAYRMRMRNPG